MNFVAALSKAKPAVRTASVALALLGLPATALHAQGASGAAAPGVAPLRLNGTTLEGKPFNLGAQRGKVVLVLYWSTDCPVCRDKMPELRRNVQGWVGQPFELVTVSTDRREQDVRDYEKLVSSVVPLQQRFATLWTGTPGHADNVGKPPQLPYAILVDKSGRTVERWQGRIPAQAWDRIADLL